MHMRRNYPQLEKSEQAKKVESWEYSWGESLNKVGHEIRMSSRWIAKRGSALFMYKAFSMADDLSSRDFNLTPPRRHSMHNDELALKGCNGHWMLNIRLLSS